MPAATVLVVAPDTKLRASLEFLFRSEGLSVVSIADLAERFDMPGANNWCAVVDENAVRAAPDGWAHLARINGPVILLVDRLHAVPEFYASEAITEPLLGQNLVSAVLEAASR